jgi:hypothetical protein
MVMANGKKGPFYDKVVGDERQVGNFIWVPQYHVPIKLTVPVPPFN